MSERNETLSEGKVQFAAAKAFYNETQTFNRDVTVLALQTYLQELQEKHREHLKFPTPTVLDALSASGLRALRYKKEIAGDILVTANDISEQATLQIGANALLNGVQIEVVNDDCNSLMHKRQFRVIDLDPYGAPTPFVSAAFQSIENEGLLMVTATDSLVTCGRQVDECLRRYQAVSVNNSFCHELSIRIVLKQLAEEANRQRCGFDVLCSFYMFHYLRVFVRVDKKRSRGVEMLQNCAEFGVCAECEWIQRGASLGALDVAETHAHCRFCGAKMKRIGPLWAGRLQAMPFIEKMRANLASRFSYFQTMERIERFLQFQTLENHDLVFFADLPSLSKFFKVTTPPIGVFANFLAQLGVNAYPTYFSPNGLRLDYDSYEKVLALFSLWFRCQVAIGRAKPDNDRKLRLQDIYLTAYADAQWIFTEQCGATEERAEQTLAAAGVSASLIGGSPAVKVVKAPPEAFQQAARIGMFLANPEKNWGPKKMK